MLRQIRIAHDCADPQPSVGKLFDLVEWQTVDVDDMYGSLDVQLHQVEQCRSARDETNACTVLCRARGCTCGDRCGRIFGSEEFEGLHGSALPRTCRGLTGWPRRYWGRP